MQIPNNPKKYIYLQINATSRARKYNSEGQWINYGEIFNIMMLLVQFPPHIPIWLIIMNNVWVDLITNWKYVMLVILTVVVCYLRFVQVNFSVKSYRKRKCKEILKLTFFINCSKFIHKLKINSSKANLCIINFIWRNLFPFFFMFFFLL